MDLQVRKVIQGSQALLVSLDQRGIQGLSDLRVMKLEEEYKDVVWKGWQKDILEMISGKPDNRAV